MARPKNEIEKAYVGLRMDEKLVSAVDSFAEQTKSNRSQVVIDAVSYYLDTRKCEICGAIIPKNSKFCPCCGNKLYSHDEIFNAAKAIRDRIVKEKGLQTGDIGNGMYVFYPLDEMWAYGKHYYHAHLSAYCPDGEVLTPVKLGDAYDYDITMDEIINELKGNSFTVDISDKKKIDVNIAVEKVKCPRCGHLNYPDSTWCTKCKATIDKHLASAEQHIEDFMLKQMKKEHTQNKK